MIIHMNKFCILKMREIEENVQLIAFQGFCY